jgi:hypothetical protein
MNRRNDMGGFLGGKNRGAQFVVWQCIYGPNESPSAHTVMFIFMGFVHSTLLYDT